jgi:DNA-binding transcriptional MerR regulator
MPERRKTIGQPAAAKPDETKYQGTMSQAKTAAVSKLSAADCARRTGVTVRALRVYERAGLIKPPRSAKGWRQYGPPELIRLNTIVALKGFGLSLRDIRKAFASSPPALVQVLDLQLRNWGARRLAADRAINLIQSAIERLRSHDDLTIDELCGLMRNAEMNDMHAIVRELINQYITPEQEREWLTYWAKRDPKDVLDSQKEMSVFRATAEEFLALMKDGASPESPAVQEVVERSQRAWLDSGLRQRQLQQLAWNPEVTRAWFALGSKVLARTATPGSVEDAARLEKFMHEAHKASRSSQRFAPLVAEARRLRGTGARRNSAEALQLAQRFAQVCREERVGDAAMHARWIAVFAPIPDEDRAAWDYLAQSSAD